MYDGSNRLTEKVFRIIIFGAVFVVYPIFMIIFMAGNYYAYFTTDLESDAFRLPFPCWYDLEYISYETLYLFS